jgi:hypothetical protein
MLSCEYNPDFTFLFYTDQEIEYAPPNVHVFPMTLAELETRATSSLGFEVRLARPYKICDLRPAFGIVFAEDLVEHEYWGHCDIDMIFGDLRAFIEADLVGGADIISARRQVICGHFSLFRNVATINSLFRNDENFCAMVNSQFSAFYDEVGMSNLVRTFAIPSGVDVRWGQWRFNYPVSSSERRGLSALPPVRQRWHWRNGKLLHRTFGGTHSEIMYLHFMTWKRSLRKCSVLYPSNDVEFVISFDEIKLGAPKLSHYFQKYPLRESFSILKQYLLPRMPWINPK